MLTETRPDFVIALGRHSSMAETALYLLDQGYPFLMEKPWASTEEFVASPTGRRRSTRSSPCARPALTSPSSRGPARCWPRRDSGPGVAHLLPPEPASSARYVAWDAPWDARPEGRRRRLPAQPGPARLDLVLFLTGEEAQVTGAPAQLLRSRSSGRDYASRPAALGQRILGNDRGSGNTFPRARTDGEWKIAGATRSWLSRTTRCG